MVKKKGNDLGENAAFGIGGDSNLLDTEVRYDILMLRQVWVMLENINKNDLLGYEKAVRGLERLIMPFMDGKYQEELKVIKVKFVNQARTIRPDKRDVATVRILNNLLDERADLLMEWAKKMGMLPKKIIWD